MENLIPPLLSAIREVKWALETGKSMKEAIQTYLESARDPFSFDLRRRWILKIQGSRAPRFDTHYRNIFWELIERGLAGQPSHASLTALESEVERAAQAELDEHVAVLPFKVLIPLLLFQFPAYLILLLGPLLRDLQSQLGG